MKYYLAIDLGASSGRHIVGFEQDGKIVLDEVHRFKNKMLDTVDGLVWDIPRLLREIIQGIKLAFLKYDNIESLSIDTWGVDYVLMNGNKEIKPFFAYRNDRTNDSSFDVHSIIPFEELYSHTGIQFAQYNTIYQLYADLKAGRLEQATDYLMLPSYFIYKLTGVKTHEFTDESTGGFLNPYTKEYDMDIIDRLGLPRKLFGKIEQPGFAVGELLPEIQKQVGGNTKVILCASHDTGSAFESVEVPKDGIILSSGTWSLLGIKSPSPILNEKSLKANYTNEGGTGYIRFLKNIMGMWIANKTIEHSIMSLSDVDKRIEEVDYKITFDVNHPSLLAPKNMKLAIMKLLSKCPPKNDLELFDSIYHSLALMYKKSIDELEEITGRKYKSIYVLGGGAKNQYLNKLIKQYTNKEVIALPIEATALGNIKVQMKASE